MFSYRHAFHAGNHADVLKHAVFVHILNHFNRKANPYWVIDTHAGAGLYDLTGEWAQKNGEFRDGIGRLAGDVAVPLLIERYLDAVSKLNDQGAIRLYPGSPWLALQALRDRDRLRLFEMHPSEAELLAQNVARQKFLPRRQVAVHRADGFDGLNALLPPPTRRGIVIIDPSYENKTDYRRTLRALNEGLKRFATGCFMIWYPMVRRLEAHELARSLERVKADSWIHASLAVSAPPDDGTGLYGSGIFVVNPPWTLYDEFDAALPWLSEKLGLDDKRGFKLSAKGS